MCGFIRGNFFVIVFFSLALCVSGIPVVFASSPTVPGAADAARIAVPDSRLRPPQQTAPKANTSEALPPVGIPAGADQVVFRLNNIVFSGLSAFQEDDLKPLYSKDLRKDVTLKWVYELAAQVTQKYRKSGYLLSYAYVPNQEIVDGVVILRVIEGRISNVVVDGPQPKSMSILGSYFKRILNSRPIQEDVLESTLLRINDLPGVGYRAILLPQAGSTNPSDFVLNLVPIPQNPKISFGVDNNASRFLGPYTSNIGMNQSFLPLQQTSLYAQSSLPTDKFNFFSLTQAAAISPDWTLEATASVTNSKPGFTLSNLDIKSFTSNWGVSANYQLWRQRQENLLLTFGYHARNVRSNFFDDIALTRDKIRTFEAALSYDLVDGFDGVNAVSVNFTQGIDGFGASPEGAANLSRSAAKPNFFKFNIAASRLQAIDENWNIVGKVAGQMSNKPLYASEEFGVGGAEIGRAYDSSDITGDAGAAASLELRYLGFRTMQPMNFEPFTYYDIGFVTNRDVGQANYESLASAGAGLRFATIWGQSGSFIMAIPLTRPVTAPIYGGDTSTPRFMLQLNQSF